VFFHLIILQSSGCPVGPCRPRRSQLARHSGRVGITLDGGAAWERRCVFCLATQHSIYTNCSRGKRQPKCSHAHSYDVRRVDQQPGHVGFQPVTTARASPQTHRRHGQWGCMYLSSQCVVSRETTRLAPSFGGREPRPQIVSPSGPRCPFIVARICRK
jgi:hypothetical protein